ncbi:MAG: glycine oxidase ThiO [Burkholderiales bacterium]
MSGAFYLISHKLNSDFLIVGAGIIGLTTAHALASRGASVTVLEKGEVGRESSWAGAGILATLPPWETPPALNTLADASVTLYPALIEELISETGIDPEFERSGALLLPPYDEHKALAWRREKGAPIEKVFVRDRIPALQANEALYLPAVAQVRPPRLLKALERRLSGLGVKLVQRNEAVELSLRGTRVDGAATAREKFSAKRVIVCAGAWSWKLLGDYALGFATAPIKGQMLLFRCEPGSLNTIVLQDEFYLVPRRDGHILAGSTLEDCGFDKGPSELAKQLLLKRAHGLLPELNESTLVHHWAGLRPSANMPVIDRHPELENLYLNAGHFRYGVTMAPGSARLLADVIFEGASTDFRWPKS